MDIYSKGEYPANKLSNFASHPFKLDGIEINSFEGFLQSLKFKCIETQKEVCKLIGYDAKKKGKDINWQLNQTLYWNGIAIKRLSDEYQSLIKRAYYSMFEQSESFRKALLDSGKLKLTHKMGHNTPSETLLTVDEFITMLNSCRDKLTKKLF